MDNITRGDDLRSHLGFDTQYEVICVWKLRKFVTSSPINLHDIENVCCLLVVIPSGVKEDV
jgi:hypothetical protein